MSAPLPLLVGAGEIVDRPADPRDGREPLVLMEAAARAALADTQASGLIESVDTVAVVTNVFHDYDDTAGLLAERLGCRPRRRLVTTWGGNTPQSLVNHLCDEIAAGRSDLALIAGAEAVATMRTLGKLGVTPAWTERRDTDLPRWGDTRSGMSDLESRHGAREAYVTFALIENAFRAARGQSIEASMREIGAFAERAAAIAADNPTAWFRDAKPAATLTTVTPQNRMVAFPYPKYLNAIMEVNQGAALLLASDGAARRLGIAADRWVYPWAGTDVTETWYLIDRTALHGCPGRGVRPPRCSKRSASASTRSRTWSSTAAFRSRPGSRRRPWVSIPPPRGRSRWPAACRGSAAPATTTARMHSPR